MRMSLPVACKSGLICCRAALRDANPGISEKFLADDRIAS